MVKNAYQSMVESHKKVSLYDFDNTNISYELKAYATVLNELNEKVSDMLSECFIDTASSYGLEERELLIGAVRDDLSIEKRREMLKLRESIDQSSFTLSQMKKSLKSFGLNSVLYEYPSLFTVVIDATGEYSTAQKAWIRTQVQKIMPAHLSVYVVFNGPTWAKSDSKNNTFSYIDSLSMTWDEIDNLE